MKKVKIHKALLTHRHHWEMEVVECPACGLGRCFICECGEVRLEDKNRKPTRKLD